MPDTHSMPSRLRRPNRQRDLTRPVQGFVQIGVVLEREILAGQVVAELDHELLFVAAAGATGAGVCARLAPELEAAALDDFLVQIVESEFALGLHADDDAGVAIEPGFDFDGLVGL